MAYRTIITNDKNPNIRAIKVEGGLWEVYIGDKKAILKGSFTISQVIEYIDHQKQFV
jgi:hypothetical protein